MIISKELFMILLMKILRKKSRIKIKNIKKSDFFKKKYF